MYMYVAHPDPIGAASAGAENRAASLLKATIHSCRSLNRYYYETWMHSAVLLQCNTLMINHIHWCTVYADIFDG